MIHTCCQSASHILGSRHDSHMTTPGCVPPSATPPMHGLSTFTGTGTIFNWHILHEHIVVCDCIIYTWTNHVLKTTSAYHKQHYMQGNY